MAVGGGHGDARVGKGEREPRVFLFLIDFFKFFIYTYMYIWSIRSLCHGNSKLSMHKMAEHEYNSTYSLESAL